MTISLGDFTKLNISVQGLFASLLLLIPFWYINILFLNYPLFCKYPIYVIVLMSYCLSIASLFGSMTSVLPYLLAKASIADDVKPLQVVGLGLMTSLLVIVMNDVSYYVFKQKVSFHEFIHDYVNLSIIFFVGSCFYYLITIRKRKGKNKQLEIKFPEN